jgi:signal peptidase
MSPAVRQGSLALIVPGDADDAHTGDVIAFRDPADPHRRMLHRIIDVSTSDTGLRYFQTQGDGNSTPDALLLPAANVDGRLAWHAPYLGRVAWALRPPVGVVLLAGVPLVVLTASETRRRRRLRQVTDVAPDPDDSDGANVGAPGTCAITNSAAMSAH